VTDLDRSVLNRIEHLQSRHDLTCGKDLNLKLVVRRVGNVLGECFAGAEQGIERFRPTHGHAPFDRRGGLRNRGCCQRRPGNSGSSQL